MIGLPTFAPDGWRWSFHENGPTGEPAWVCLSPHEIHLGDGSGRLRYWYVEMPKLDPYEKVLQNPHPAVLRRMMAEMFEFAAHNA